MKQKYSYVVVATLGALFAIALLPGAITQVSATSCTAPGVTCVSSGFMTGGGRFNGNINNAPPPNSTIPILVHGFTLHCNANVSPNNLEINWKDPVTGAEHQFHLEQLTFAQCAYIDSVGTPNPPTANFNTWWGNGTGRLDGQSGAFIYAIFTDQSQPAGTQAGGPGDWSTIVIYAANGTLVLSVTDSLFGGAQQAHMCHGNC